MHMSIWSRKTDRNTVLYELKDEYQQLSRIGLRTLKITQLKFQNHIWLQALSSDIILSRSTILKLNP